MAAWWAVTIAAGTALGTWSGRLYLPMPWWWATLAGTGAAGAALGWVLSQARLLLRPWGRMVTFVIPVLVAAVLIDLGAPADTGFAPDIWTAVRDYRGGCLSGTEYTDTAAELSITTDVVTLSGAQGGQLRFTRTGSTWPSLDRAEIWGLGVAPRDRSTRLALAAVGCD